MATTSAPGNTVGVSPFPQPPEYARLYTDANIEKKVVLAAPAVPQQFIIFGEEYNFEEEMIRSLQSQKMQQLFSSTGDWRSELKKLNRSSIAAFLDLLDILVRCPNHPERLEKINNLRLLFINMHHLINEYRPIQARDTLQIMMKKQIKSIEDVTSRFREYLALGQEMLNQVVQDVPIIPKDDKSQMDKTPCTPSSDIKHEKTDIGRSALASRKAARKRDEIFCQMLDADKINLAPVVEPSANRFIKMEY